MTEEISEESEEEPYVKEDLGAGDRMINYMGIAAKDASGRVISAADSESERRHYEKELAY